MELEFSPHIFKNSQISNFTNILPMGAELFYADRRTDSHDEVNNRFSQFSESAQNVPSLTAGFGRRVFYCKCVSGSSEDLEF